MNATTGITTAGWLKARRKELDLTQEALAERVGCSADTVRKIEAGKQRPSQQLAGLLATELGVPADERPAAVRRLRTLGPPAVAWRGGGGPVPAPAAASAPPAWSRHGLPIPATALIGCEAEIGRLLELLLRFEARLVTLLGPPGIGKTRLALAVAQSQRDEFADGVWFVELAALTDPALLPATIARLFGISESAGASVIERLASYLRDKQLLLVLDNCEHLPAAAATVALLLQEAPGLKVLATSRAPLRVYGEKEYPVPALRVPEAQAALPLAELADYEAVRLFAERARDIAPDFTLTGENAAAVAAICRRLDGLPLALELAAARIRILPPGALLARLSNSLTLLTGGPSTLPRRQQTLQAAIEWSYDLLNPDEQRLFRRLGVFQGGATLEAIAAVCADEGSGDEALEAVHSLVSKNLLKQRIGRSGEPRFWMLETIHEFARAKLHASRQAAALRWRHAFYMCQLAQLAQPHWRNAAQAEWSARLEDDLDNLWAALSWSVEDAPGEEFERALLSLRLSAILWWFWGMTRAGEARRWLGLALQRESQLDRAGMAKAQIEQLDRAMIGTLQSAANAAGVQDDQQAANALTQQMLDLSYKLGDKLGTARALHDLGLWAMGSGDYARAAALLDESLTLKRELGDTHSIIPSLNALGIIGLRQQNYERARSFFEECLRLSREQRDNAYTDASLANLSEVAYCQADYARSRVLIEESRAVAAPLDLRERTAHYLLARAAIDLQEFCLHGRRRTAPGIDAADLMAQAQRAARLLGAAEAIYKAVGTTPYVGENSMYMQTIVTIGALLNDQEFAAVRRQGQAMTDEQATAYLGEVAPAARHKPPSRWLQARATSPAAITAAQPAVAVLLEALPAHDGNLTPRETEVLRLLAGSLTDIQIAECLVLSRRTVQAHIRAIYAKLDVHNRSAATRYAIECGLR
jgi:predicted ATPase/DNA-binding CsgD family transcriptional regulator/transcriptional regulator with XRE-family HTH domain